jgi:hypothetical protein
MVHLVVVMEEVGEEGITTTMGLLVDMDVDRHPP